MYSSPPSSSSAISFFLGPLLNLLALFLNLLPWDPGSQDFTLAIHHDVSGGSCPGYKDSLPDLPIKFSIIFTEDLTLEIGLGAPLVGPLVFEQGSCFLHLLGGGLLQAPFDTPVVLPHLLLSCPSALFQALDTSY